MPNEVVGSARALTGARCGALAATDEAGAPHDFVTSGFTDDEHPKRVEWPDGPRRFEHCRDLPGPPRLADVPDDVRSLGFSPDRLPSGPSRAPRCATGASMSATSTWSGRGGGEAFTEEDEELLVLFAAQAAGAGAGRRRDGAGRGGHVLGAGRPGRRARLGGGHPAGPGAASGARAHAGRAPGHGEPRAAASVAVTRQDLAPLQEPERTPAELPGMASHELPPRWRSPGRTWRRFRSPSARRPSSRAWRATSCRLGGGHPAGPGAASGARAHAGRAPGHGEPRAAASVAVTRQDLAPPQEPERTPAELPGMASHELPPRWRSPGRTWRRLRSPSARRPSSRAWRATSCRLGGGHPAGPGAASGARAHAGRAPGHRLAEVRTEIAALDTRLSTQMATLDTRLSTQIADLRTERTTEIAGVRTETADVRTEIASLETRLIPWMVGTVLATATLTFGILRLPGWRPPPSRAPCCVERLDDDRRALPVCLPAVANRKWWRSHGLLPNGWRPRVRAAAAASAGIPPASAAGHFVVGPSVATQAAAPEDLAPRGGGLTPPPPGAAIGEPFEHDSRTASGAGGRPAGRSPGVCPPVRG